MSNIITICKREIHSFFVSPLAYFVITGYVLLAGFFFFNLLGRFNLLLNQHLARPFGGPEPRLNLNQQVIEGYYHTLIVILVFLIPLLTMRLFAEERKSGTFELLMTSPLSLRAIVVGKFLGVLFMIGVMTGLTFFFPLLLYVLGNPEAGPMLSGAIGVLLCAAAFAALGLAISGLTDNQVVAGVSTMVTLLFLYAIHAPAESLGETGLEVLRFISPLWQVRDLLQGIITFTAGVYFISMIVFGLFLSERILEVQRLRS